MRQLPHTDPQGRSRCWSLPIPSPGTTGCRSWAVGAKAPISLHLQVQYKGLNAQVGAAGLSEWG